MVSFDLTAAVVFTTVFALVAAMALTLAATTAGRFLVSNRRVRIARHQSMRTYYRGLVLSH